MAGESLELETVRCCQIKLNLRHGFCDYQERRISSLNYSLMKGDDKDERIQSFSHPRSIVFSSGV
jgi:hypothetical protein